MKEKKSIDRLFQEKFKDFEVQPDPKVWEAIVDAKDKKRDRVVPLWLKWAGVAAVLAGLLIGSDILLNQTDQPLVTTKASKNIEPQNKSDTDDPLLNNSENEKLVQENTSEESGKSDQEAGTLVSKNSTENPSQTSDASNQPAGFNSASEPKANDKNLAFAEKNSTRPPVQEEASTQNGQNGSGANTFQPGRLTSTSEVKELLSVGDLLAENEADGKSLEELLNANNTSEETNTDKETLASKWGIMPTIAPVYYGSTGGSGIDPQFNTNQKTGQVNLSYGLQVSYAVNDKVTVRSGVNRVDLSYNTNNISYNLEIDAAPIASIDYSGNSAILNVEGNARSRSNLNADFFSSAEFKSNAASTRGNLNQSLNYLEIPLELEYVLINKKIGLQAIGGLSTLLLTDNFIAIEAQNENIEIGQSNSLNPTSFSANVGIGLDYRFSKKIQFNLEPMFKYQMNAYTNTVSDFRPFYMGLYTGIKIAF
ncbi:MAG: hypothetical protein WBG71_05110 [Leeuwenhoekiella sp.]